MNRNQKTDLVKTLRNTFEDSASVVVVHCLGLTVAESTELRNKMRNDDCYFKVTKNKLTCLLYTSPSPRDISGSRMPSSA